MSDVWILRTGIIIAGVLLLAAIYYFGRPGRGPQGRRRSQDARRIEPTLGEQLQRMQDGDAGAAQEAEAVQVEMPLGDDPGAQAAAGPEASGVGRRTSGEFEKIVTL